MEHVPSYYQYEPGEGLRLPFKNLTEKDLRKILLKLSSKSNARRNVHPRKCRKLDGVGAILAKLPPSKPPVNFHVVGNTTLGDAGMKHLHLIPESVLSLDVSKCGLTPAGVKRVCDFMKTNTTILRLVMWGNHIGLQGAKDIVEMLKVNETLQVLSIKGGGLGDLGGEEGFSEIAKGLAVNDTLRELDVGDRRFIRDCHVMKLIPGLIVNEGLETLDLSRTSVTIEALKEIALQVLERGNNVHLKHIKVSRGYIADAGSGITDETWLPIEWWLHFNRCDRWVIYNKESTRRDWVNALVKSSQHTLVDFSFELLRAKPDLFIHPEGINAER